MVRTVAYHGYRFDSYKRYMELNIKILGIMYFSFLITLTYVFNVYLCFINIFLFLSVTFYVLSFILFFYFLPVFFFKGPINLQKNFLEGLLLSQLYFMRETYIGGFTGKRKLFYYFTLVIGMVFLRVFDLYFIIISYFILVIFNTVVILFGLRKDSFIWNFYVNQLGYDKVVQIVGTPY